MPIRRTPARLAQSDTWLLEVFLGLYTAVWGLGFANPLTESFAVSPMAYRFLSRFPGGELGFGLSVAAFGVLTLSATFGLHRPTRAFMIGLAGVFWVVVLFSVAIPTSWAAGGLWHFALAALAHWFCWARLRYSGVG